MKNGVIITAGGSGKRFDLTQKKQFVQLYNKPLIEWTILPFYTNSNIHEICLVLPKDEINDFKYLEEKYSLIIVSGGKERQDSVYNGLEAVENLDLVMIHDGVRPIISQKLINLLLTKANELGSAIPASKVIHTIKKIKNNKILGNVSRENLIEVYTPQTFRFNELKELHSRARNDGLIFTDDSSLYHYYGKEVYWVESPSDNIKITTKSDVPLAEFLMNNKRIFD